LKNSFEWLKSGGEMQHMKVVAMTFTPTAPRGEKAMRSLLDCLIALETEVLCSLALYASEVQFDNEGRIIDGETIHILSQVFKLLQE